MLGQNCHMMKKVFSKHCPQVLWPRFYPKDKYLSLLLRVNHVRIILQGKINPHLHHQEIKEGHLTRGLPVLVIKEKGGLTVEALAGKEPIIAIMIETEGIKRIGELIERDQVDLQGYLLMEDIDSPLMKDRYYSNLTPPSTRGFIIKPLKHLKN